MNEVIADLKRWGDEGFNTQEEKAFGVGYINNYFSKYLQAKKKLLEARDNTSEPNKRKLLNAARIYSYTLFENTWFGYLASYSDDQVSIFKIDDKEVKFTNPYKNHLPSFSSAILNFGTCRDLFFILLKLCAHQKLVDDQSGIKKLLNVQYKSVGDFKEDLKTLSSDESYLREGENFYNRNMFRNFFAHRIRLLWWHNQNCSETDYFVCRHVYNAIQRRNKSDYLRHVEEIFEDHTTYEGLITTSNCTDLISSTEMLRETHDIIAKFLNKSFGLLKLYSINIDGNENAS